MIAITEHYAQKKFGPNTLSTMFQHPAGTIGVFRRYIDKDDEYYREVGEVELPITTANEVAKSQMWVGYYHQTAAYDESSDARLRIGKRIADLRKSAGMTQEQLATKAGIHQVNLSRIEAGRYAVGLDILDHIAQALGGRVDIITD